MVLYYRVVTQQNGLSWYTYAKKMSHKGHAASKCFSKMDVEFQWCTSFKKKKLAEEAKIKRFILMFLALAACSEALPQAGLSVGSTNREADSAKLDVYIVYSIHLDGNTKAERVLI